MGSIALLGVLGLLWAQVLSLQAEKDPEPLQRISRGTSFANCKDSVLTGLKAFFNATSGAHWTRNDGWNDEGSSQCCDWYGVTCNNAGEPSAINLIRNNVTGHIPDQLASGLSDSLENLTLSHNRIKSLPDNVGDLYQLRTLDISQNAGSLALPTSLGNLTKLLVLHIGNGTLYPPFEGEQLVEVPDSLAQLTKLQILNLSHNSLWGELNPGIFQLPNLRVLDLSLGQLEIGFPSTGVRKMKHLQYLDLDYNAIGEIPDDIGSLSELVSLSVSAMPGVLHSAIPESIGALSGLKYLSITNNYNMGGPVPDSIWNLTSLRLVLLPFFLYLTLCEATVKSTKLRKLKFYKSVSYQKKDALLLVTTLPCLKVFSSLITKNKSKSSWHTEKFAKNRLKEKSSGRMRTKRQNRKVCSSLLCISSSPGH